MERRLPLRERKKLTTRQTIVRAAGTLVEAGGYEKTTMRDIAGAAKLSYQTLYNYFPTKAQVLKALLTADMTSVAATASEIVEGYDGDLLDSLYALNRCRLEVISHRDRDLWRVVAMDVWQDTGSSGHVFDIIDVDAWRTLQTLLNRAQGLGHLDPYVDVDLLADTLHVLSQQAFSRYIMDARRSKTELLKTLQDQQRLVVIPYVRTYLKSFPTR